MSDAPPRPAPPSARTAEPRWWSDPATWAVLIALAVWMVPLTGATGGRDRLALTSALLLLVPALVVVRPWRFVSRLDLIALAPAGAALVACVVSPTGFDGLGELAGFAYAGVLFVVIRGYLNSGGRLTLVVGALCVAGVDQFVVSWWSWYGRQTSDSLMVGTFFWHNQFAVFMAALGLVGAAVLVRGTGRVQWIAGVVVVCSVPALVFAASRASLLLYVGGLVALALASFRRPRSLVLLIVAPLLGVALAVLLASPLLMDASKSVATNIEQRETVVGTGAARLYYDQVALRLIGDHPVTGTGFDSFAGASAPLLPVRFQPTIYVHNGYLEAFLNGGLLLGLVVVVAAMLPLLIGLRRMWRARLGRSGDAVDAATLGAFLALGLLAVHSAVDVDWSYPSLLALYAILAAVVSRALPAPLSDDSVEAVRAPAPRRGRIVLVAVAITMLVALPASVRASVAAAPSNELPRWAVAASFGVSVRNVPSWMRGAAECAARLRGDLGTPSDLQIATDVDCIAAAAHDAPSLAMLRARGLMQLGRGPEAHALAADLVARFGTRIPQLVIVEAQLPHDAGDDGAARLAVRAALRDPRVVASPAAQAYGASVLAGLGPDKPTG